MNSNLCFVEEAFSKKKEKEESQSESDDDWPAPDVSWSWLGLSAEESIGEIFFKIENDSDQGEAKRRKLEHDPISSSAPIRDDGSCGGDCSSSAMEVDHEEEEENIKKYFKFRRWIRKRSIPLIQPERSPLTALEEDVPGILENPDVNENAPPEPYATSCIMEQMIFERAIFQVNQKYKAVKYLYEHIPYITHCDSIEEIRKKIDCTIEPISYLDDTDFREAVEIYKRLLERMEQLFHPLIRKSLKNEFFSLVDIEAKFGQRDFLEYWERGRNFSPLEQRVFQQMSRTKGLRDEEYVNCCKQIELQGDFDYYIQDLCRCYEKIKPDSRIEDLIRDEDVVTKRFKELDPELLQLSLMASIKSQGPVKQHNQGRTYLQLLHEKHSKKETDDIDKMLIEFCTKFPCIFDFPLDKALDSAVEERFKDIIDKMKRMYFTDIADHYAIEGTLLYMKSIYFEGVDEPSWPIVYRHSRLFSMMTTCRIIHEHPFYDRVFTVDFNLA